MHPRPTLPRATVFAAMGSIVSLLAQAVFALFLLKLFDPSAVGEFSVASQIAFCWATLALAQSHLSLLVNHQQAAHVAARHAWFQSMVRMAWMGPWMALALWWSFRQNHANNPGWLMLAPWVIGIAVLQLSWLLAQSLTLRTRNAPSIALVRLLPPVLAALTAWLGAWAFTATHSTTLLLSALIGYGIGASWLLGVWRKDTSNGSTSTNDIKTTDHSATTADPRSTRLKLLHTLTDVMTSTLLAVQWQSLYGAAEAGMLLVLLRVFGFIPGLVHSAWAQVSLSQIDQQRRPSLQIGMAACAVVLTLALAIQAALHMDWLQPGWQGLQGYLWPLMVWQMAACLIAAHAHLPFAQGRAIRYSWQCIGFNAGLITLLLLPPLLQVPAHAHLLWISAFMAVVLAGQTLDLRTFPRRHTPAP